MANFLSLSKIYKSFWQGSDKIDVLKNINFTFYFDKRYAIIGPSGTGKSTLLHIIAGVDNPTSGNINWNNEFEVNKLLDKEKETFWQSEISVIFQQPNLIEELTVLENVMLKGMILGQENYFSNAKQLLLQVGLQDRLNSFPSSLSKGEGQRVAIARALMSSPKLILADEPSGSLDSKTGIKVVNILQEMCAKNGAGLILSTHDSYVYNSMDKILEISDCGLKAN